MVEEEDLVLADGFNEAIIGIAERADFQQPVVAYDTSKIIEILMKDGCTEDEAWEHFEYNILGSFIGCPTPVFIMPKEYSDILEGLI